MSVKDRTAPRLRVSWTRYACPACACSTCNPTRRIIARSDYIRDAPALRAAGADVVYSGEAEIALAVTEGILRDLSVVAAKIG